MGPVAPRHVGSSQTRAQTRVPCISRQILNHCATREALSSLFKNWKKFAALHGWVPLFCLPAHWLILLPHPVCCWTPLVCFSILLQLMFGTFSYFLFVEVLTVFIHSSPEFSEHLYDHYFELCIRGTACLHFGDKFCLVLLIGTYSSVSSFCLILKVFFSVRYINYLPILKE